MPAVSARTLPVPSPASGFPSSFPIVLLLALLAFILAVCCVFVIFRKASCLAHFPCRTPAEDIESTPFEPMSALTALDLKLLSHPYTHFVVPTYLPQPHSREAPALIITSPIIHLNDIALPPTDLKFDIPLIGCTASLEEAALLAVRKPDVQIEISQPRAPEESTSDVSTSPLLSSCRCLSLTEPSSAPNDTEDTLSPAFQRSPTDGDGRDVQKAGEDTSFLASDSTPTSALSPSSSLSSYDGSTGRLGTFFSSDCVSDSGSNASLCLYTCSHPPGDAFSLQFLPGPTSHTPTLSSPSPSLEHSLSLDNSASDATLLDLESNWDSILTKSTSGLESQDDSSVSDCSFHLPMTLPPLPPAPQPAILGRSKERSLLRNASNEARLEAWGKEDDLCLFDSVASRKRHAIYASLRGKENILDSC